MCFVCPRRVTGADVRTRFEWRQAPDGEHIYGPGAPDGSLAEATGPLLRVCHHKCYFAWQKQQQLAAAKAADPPSRPAQDSDWRHQEIVDVEDLLGHEGDGDHRGAGAPG